MCTIYHSYCKTTISLATETYTFKVNFASFYDKIWSYKPIAYKIKSIQWGQKNNQYWVLFVKSSFHNKANLKEKISNK